MPLTASAVDVLGIATLVLVVLLACLGLGCVLYVLRFRARIHKERLPVALKDFNALWIVRITLILLAMLWCLVELLRLPLLRRQNWLLHSISFRWQANMCRIYILSSIGFLEPCFFLTALFLVHGSLSNAPFTPRKAWNGKMVALILICCLPVFLLQLFFVVISPTFEFKGGYSAQKEGYNHRLPSYFTEAFEGVQLDSQRQVAIEAAAARSGSERPLSISLSMFGSDDDEAALVHHPRHNHIRRTSLDTDVEFVAATAGRKTFIPVDRAGSFSDHQSSGIAFGSPDSPALPGKPLLSRSSRANSHFL
ncbi:hypothetical protein CY35_08G141400 [Sphagnum magellanicum]|nr:hypothetical protein CY35_08G141400 [Sphagnum magellanicum]KAH9555916.1 hypothetical protein CY35_08G141400 [Sphagnum magellanicum]KAH9555918.1 hypothetical protein CY35_08G141400 [Sphagnum magellanicum]